MAFLQRQINRGSISTGFNIDNSLKFEADNSEYMHYTCSGQTDYERMAYSVWLKRTELSTSQVFMEFGHGTANTSNLRIGFDSSDRLFCYGNSIVWRQTNQLFRDTAAWYHLFFLFDTTTPGGVSNNRIRIWVNGEMIDHGDFGVINNPGAGSAMGFNNSLNHSIGRQTEDATNYFCGYMAQAYASGGTPPVVTDFGEVDEDTGIWKPIDISEITPPDANGFNLDFTTASDLGNDISSRDNNFTEVNITAADQATDTPTNNFCTISTPFEPYVGGPPTITEGATIMTAGSSGQQDSYGTMALFKGKWYFEFSVLHLGGLAIANMFGGVVKVNRLLQGSYNNAANGHHSHDGGWGGNASAVGVHAASVSGFSAVSGAAVDVVIGVAVDMDNGKIWWASGGTYASSSGSVSNPANGTLPQFTNLLTQYPGEPVVPAYNHYVHQATTKGAFNFGNPFDHAFTDIGTNSDANGYGSFAYTPPAGYYAICSKNLAEYG
jgi:hypothetical protein